MQKLKGELGSCRLCAKCLVKSQVPNLGDHDLPVKLRSERKVYNDRKHADVAVNKKKREMTPGLVGRG